ncbi:hypothetical protein N3K66_004599 [Trichothecium roseum]|uniref:Uncharacterized protein n=1 Tax=Trichothecium roseum TaxID=47278 RepID=A0ACC0V1U1_9HYPO|nr:hypothetical protein N3K66_004599 [Trichothecium roseum]
MRMPYIEAPGSQDQFSLSLHQPVPIRCGQKIPYCAAGMPGRITPKVTGYPSPVSLPADSPRPVRTPPRSADPSYPPALPPHKETSVAQALEIARESPDGAQDATVAGILEAAIQAVWERLMHDPTKSYVMSRSEFAVFNYFQHRFGQHHVATAARARYWNHARG